MTNRGMAGEDDTMETRQQNREQRHRRGRRTERSARARVFKVGRATHPSNSSKFRSKYVFDDWLRAPSAMALSAQHGPTRARHQPNAPTRSRTAQATAQDEAGHSPSRERETRPTVGSEYSHS